MSANLLRPLREDYPGAARRITLDVDVPCCRVDRPESIRCRGAPGVVVIEPGASRTDRPPSMNEVTRILEAIDQGDPAPPIGSCRWSTTNCASWPPPGSPGRRPGQTLQATALVHEAYLRLVDGDDTKPWNSRGHFFGAAAEAMRRILVENARRKARRPARRRR